MKRSKFIDSQIMEALKRVDAGLAVPKICRELEISMGTFYKWRVKPLGDAKKRLGLYLVSFNLKTMSD
jgi:hypothetical protein